MAKQNYETWLQKLKRNSASANKYKENKKSYSNSWNILSRHRKKSHKSNKNQGKYQKTNKHK